MGHWTAKGIVGVLLVCLTVSPALAAAPSSPRSPEYLIKAAYLYNFAMFIDWPSDAFSSEDSPIVIGILGTDPFGWALDRTVQDKTINHRPLIVERLQWSQELRHCHILFVSASDAPKFAEVAHRLAGSSVLIVGDTPEATSSGGTINFTVEDNKVQFEINVDAARRARLKISSKLLNLAKVVRRS
jgi:hypothetical protein